MLRITSVVPVNDEQKLSMALDSLMEHFADYDPRAISTEAISKYRYAVIGKQFAQLYEKMKKKGN